MRYPALIDGEAGSYGVVFPDLPLCVAMGSTIDEAILHAEEAMRDWIDDSGRTRPANRSQRRWRSWKFPMTAVLASVLWVRSGRQESSVRMNLVLDAGVAEAINAEAERRQMSRKHYLEWMVRFVASAGA